MVIVLVTFLSVIVVGMSYLTLNEQISGDALLFFNWNNYWVCASLYSAIGL